MSWAMLLLILCEIAQEDAAQSKKRAVRAAEKKRENSDSPNPSDGGVLAEAKGNGASGTVPQELIQRCFNKLWATNARWATPVFQDALAFARRSEPRDEDILYRALDSTMTPGSGTPLKQDEISSLFVQNVWPSLKTRGWKAFVLSDGAHAGKTQYSYDGKQVRLSACGSSFPDGSLCDFALLCFRLFISLLFDLFSRNTVLFDRVGPFSGGVHPFRVGTRR